MLHEMLADCTKIVLHDLEEREVVMAEDWLIDFCFGMRCGQTREVHREIATIKGKPTRKYLHVIITRMETGRYELVHYIL